MEASTIITRMVLTLETRFHDPRHTSTTTSPSTIADGEDTPASSTDLHSLADIRLDDRLVLLSPEWLSFTGPAPSHIPEASPIFQAAGASEEFASPVSDPLGFNPWSHWPQQNNDMWRQSLSPSILTISGVLPE